MYSKGGIGTNNVKPRGYRENIGPGDMPLGRALFPFDRVPTSTPGNL